MVCLVWNNNQADDTDSGLYFLPVCKLRLYDPIERLLRQMITIFDSLSDARMENTLASDEKSQSDSRKLQVVQTKGIQPKLMFENFIYRLRRSGMTSSGETFYFHCEKGRKRDPIDSRKKITVCRVYLHAMKDGSGNFVLKNRPKSDAHTCVNNRSKMAKMRLREAVQSVMHTTDWSPERMKKQIANYFDVEMRKFGKSHGKMNPEEPLDFSFKSSRLSNQCKTTGWQEQISRGIGKRRGTLCLDSSLDSGTRTSILSREKQEKDEYQWDSTVVDLSIRK